MNKPKIFHLTREQELALIAAYPPRKGNKLWVDPDSLKPKAINTERQPIFSYTLWETKK